MKNIKSYKLFESDLYGPFLTSEIKKRLSSTTVMDITDICQELTDEGFEVNINVVNKECLF